MEDVPEDRRLPADPEEPIARLLRDLRATPEGLSRREAERRLVVHGPNVIRQRGGPSLWREVLSQLVHPLALLLWVAAGLSAAVGTVPLAVAIVAVIVLNAAVAVVQERQAERAVEALVSYLPPTARALRDGVVGEVDARDLVPGDIVDVAEGDRVSADLRLLDGGVEVDLSTLTGESLPVHRSAGAPFAGGSLLDARDLLFSGTACTGGGARGVVVATGMRTELGRIAALTQRVEREPSPLETQVRRVAWLIAAVAVAAGAVFLLLGWAAAGLPLADTVQFAIGLLVANVPEGLLPTITLALAVGVRALGRRGALVKRLSAVETLGSTTVICTDKTGTLTENRMRAVAAWTPDGDIALPGRDPAPALARLLRRAATCTTAGSSGPGGDPTELAILAAAKASGVRVDPGARDAARVRVHHFDPVLRLMTSVDRDGDRIVVTTKGAPEEVLARTERIADGKGERRLGRADRELVERAGSDMARRGLRVLAVATRRVDEGGAGGRSQDEGDLTLLGLVGLLDPPRAEVADAVARCRGAGIRIIVVSGDAGETAAAIARMVGIVGEHPTVVTGRRLAALSEPDLDALLRGAPELVFARCAPEAKLRIADALRAEGHVVAMTGDGVNDAPALRRADIGVAMGRSGTDVAREAATMILTDDDFATIVDAVEEGRRVYANVRKFILYIFAHLPPEVVPFLVFALSGGAIPLPLTVMQILAIDLGTETLPALALGREPAEPGVMDRPPRARSERVIDRHLLARAWGWLGLSSAALVMGAFLAVLLEAGWAPGDDVTSGTPLHEPYVQATTITFLGIVACQVGVALAARTDLTSLTGIGILSNPLLLWGIAFELVVTAAIVVIPGVQSVFQTAVPEPWMIAMLLPFPVIVWGIDEAARAARRRHAGPGRPIP